MSCDPPPVGAARGTRSGVQSVSHQCLEQNKT